MAGDGRPFVALPGAGRDAEDDSGSHRRGDHVQRPSPPHAPSEPAALDDAEVVGAVCRRRRPPQLGARAIAVSAILGSCRAEERFSVR